MRGGEQFFVVFSDVTGARFLQFGQRFIRFTRFAPAALTCSAFGLRLKEKEKDFFFQKKREQVFFGPFFLSFFLLGFAVIITGRHCPNGTVGLRKRVEGVLEKER